MTFSADLYQQALAFAADAHGEQRIPGSRQPYIVHTVSVAAEILAEAAKDTFDVELAMVCALLHDTLEDPQASPQAVAERFGERVLRGVQALSKDERLPKEQRMADSLARILREPREIGMVKLADRIVNLLEPPAYWSRSKRAGYQEEARQIHAALAGCSAPLAARLAERIESYSAFLSTAATSTT